jgi:hypothetical protein
VETPSTDSHENILLATGEEFGTYTLWKPPAQTPIRISFQQQGKNLALTSCGNPQHRLPSEHPVSKKGRDWHLQAVETPSTDSHQNIPSATRKEALTACIKTTFHQNILLEKREEFGTHTLCGNPRQILIRPPNHHPIATFHIPPVIGTC